MSSTKGLERIGQGTFTTAYKKNSTTVLLKSDDVVKECMSLGGFPSSNYFPKLKRLEINDDGISIYESKLYEKVRSPKKQLKESHYEIYKQLLQLDWYYSFGYENILEGIDFIKIPSYLKEHLRHAVYSLVNYGTDVIFEISPRNIATTPTGQLILLDCFFMQYQLKEKR